MFYILNLPKYNRCVIRLNLTRIHHVMVAGTKTDLSSRTLTQSNKIKFDMIDMDWAK